MYYWKCWRDNKIRIIVFVIIGIAIGCIGFKGSWQRQEDSLIRTHDFWVVWNLILFLSQFFGSLAALTLGAAGLGEEFPQKTIDFLFTRPRKRRYFVWMGWIAGVLQVATILAIYFAFAFLVLICRTKAPFQWIQLFPIAATLIVSLLAYSVAYTMTAALRGRNGFAASIGLIFIYSGSASLISSWWGIHLPSPEDLFPDWSVAFLHPELGIGIFPLGAALMWIVAAVLCPAFAQFRVARIDL